MKIRFLLPLALIAVATGLTTEGRAAPVYFYADTSRVTVSGGSQYDLATGEPGAVKVYDSSGQLVSGTATWGASFYLEGTRVIGYFTIDIPSPGIYSFSIPAQGAEATRFYSACYSVVDQGDEFNPSYVIEEGDYFGGEGFPGITPEIYDPNVIPFPSGPATIIKPPLGRLGFKVPIERVGHFFQLKWKASATAAPTTASGSVHGFVTSSGMGPTAVIEHLMVSAPTPSVPIDEWWIFDASAGQESAHHSEPPDANSSVLGDVWTQVSGVPRRYFAIPDSRRYHNFIMWDNNSWTTAQQSYNPIGTYSNGTYGVPVSLHWFPVYATGSVSSTIAFIADLTASEKAMEGRTDARLAGAWSWDPMYASYPLLDTNVTLPAREVGHKFAVHRKATNGPELSQVYTAVSAPPNAKLNFPVGKGLRFWVTREAENGVANQPVAPVGAKATNYTGWVNNTAGATFSAISPNPNLFPAAPNRPSWAMASRPVRIKANEPPDLERNFTVWLGDGYTTTYDAGPNSHLDPVTGLTVPAYTLGSINEWNGIAFPIGEPPLRVYEFTALTDWRYDVTLQDQTTSDVFIPSDLGNRIDWLAPWVSPTLTAPPGPTITLQLPVSRGGSIFSFARPDLADAATGHPYTALQYESETGQQPFSTPGTPPVAPIASYTFDVFSVTLTNPTPDVPGFFPLVDLASDDPIPVAVKAGTNDLRMWFPAPQPQELQISSSRWDHVLRLCHPNGESYPITREQLLGDVSEGPGGTIYPNPYYVFSARSVARPELSWYIEDLSADPVQRIGPSGTNLGPTNDELIPWYYLPAPKGLTGVISVGLRRFELVWSSAGASAEGAFELQSRLPGDAEWSSSDPLPAQQMAPGGVFGLEADGLYHFRQGISMAVPAREFRVRYLYGSVTQYSEPSNEITLSGWEDSDGDGMPDAWEMAYFGSLSHDGSGNEDGDAYTNLQEFLNHTNPNALPAGAAGSTLVVYTPLQ